MEAKKSEENGRDAMEKRATIVIKLVKLDRPSFAMYYQGGGMPRNLHPVPFLFPSIRFVTGDRSSIPLFGYFFPLS